VTKAKLVGQGLEPTFPSRRDREIVPMGGIDMGESGPEARRSAGDQGQATAHLAAPLWPIDAAEALGDLLGMDIRDTVAKGSASAITPYAAGT
jgi:hypothetical protein